MIYMQFFRLKEVEKPLLLYKKDFQLIFVHVYVHTYVPIYNYPQSTSHGLITNEDTKNG